MVPDEIEPDTSRARERAAREARDTVGAVRDGQSPPADIASPGEADDYLFSDVVLRPPLVELRDVYERRRRALDAEHAAAQVDRLERAWELARLRLEAALGSAVACEAGSDPQVDSVPTRAEEDSSTAAPAQDPAEHRSG